jgi:hypothetical protein
VDLGGLACAGVRNSGDVGSLSQLSRGPRSGRDAIASGLVDRDAGGGNERRIPGQKCMALGRGSRSFKGNHPRLPRNERRLRRTREDRERSTGSKRKRAGSRGIRGVWRWVARDWIGVRAWFREITGAWSEINGRSRGAAHWGEGSCRESRLAPRHPAAR